MKAHRCSFAIGIVCVLSLLAHLILTHENGNHHHSIEGEKGPLEGEQSDTISVTSGIPQGTVLGPILFLVYINDFNEYLKHSTLRLFADDIIIYKQINSISDARDL